MTEPIDVVAVGVCGSDVQRLRSGFDVRSVGHELVGRDADGRVVAIRPLQPCLACRVCARGWTEHCPNDASIGRADTREGGFSGRVFVSSGQIYPIPEQLPMTIATLADPLACVLHALRGMSLVGARLLIIGDGPMAAVVAVHARRLDVSQVTIAVKDASRAARVAAFADFVVTSGSAAVDHYDVVVEAVGGMSSEPILTAANAVAPLGQVVGLGVYPPHVAAALPVRALLEKESSLRGSKAYRVGESSDDFATALDHLASDHQAFAPIITSRPSWSPRVRRPQILERGIDMLKIVHVNDPAIAET